MKQESLRDRPIPDRIERVRIGSGGVVRLPEKARKVLGDGMILVVVSRNTVTLTREYR